jgi:hypothetical protein
MLLQSDRRRGRLGFVGGGRIAATTAAISTVLLAGQWGKRRRVVAPALAVAALAGTPR